MDVVVGHVTSTWSATIWIGTKQRSTGIVFPFSEVLDVCQRYCDEVGFCVSVTPTQFIYTTGEGGGGEPGAAVGIINYPRFPEEPPDLEAHAVELARRLANHLEQQRVSLVMPDRTVMLAKGNL